MLTCLYFDGIAFCCPIFLPTGITPDRTELFERMSRTDTANIACPLLLANETSPYQPDADALYLLS